MKKSILFISCEEAKHICDKSQYGEANLWERFKLSLRLSWCKITRAYTKNNNALTKVIKESKVEALNSNELNSLEKEFQKQLEKQH